MTTTEAPRELTPAFTLTIGCPTCESAMEYVNGTRRTADGVGVHSLAVVRCPACKHHYELHAVLRRTDITRSGRKGR